MSVFVNKKTKVLCQGITGTQATFHIRRSIDYGTQVLAGVSPGKAGMVHLGVPVFNTVKEAKQETGVNASIMYVPSIAVKAAVREAVEAELDLAVSIADGVPIKDMMEIKSMLRGSKTKFIGPNTPGIITPNEARLGIFPENIHKKGKIGVVSRSSTLTYEAVIEINKANKGQSTVIGLGDDMVIGMDFIEVIDAFHKDKNTNAIVLIGQLGGSFEEKAAEYYQSLPNKKPIIAFVAGEAVPFDHKMGYAGELISNGYVSVSDKKRIMQKSGMIVVDNINDINEILVNM